MKRPEPLSVSVRQLGLRPYEETWRAMRAFTDARQSGSPSEIWFLEHPPIFTLGQAGRPEHLLAPGDIPVIHTDRGGQVTYHGPGQLVAYLLLDLHALGVGVRALVERTESAVVDLLMDFGIDSETRREAPGVYVRNSKIAALGLRVRRGFTYHGLSLNVNMNLEPFGRINPCGYAGLKTTQLAALGIDLSVTETATRLLPHLLKRLGYTSAHEHRPAESRE